MSAQDIPRSCGFWRVENDLNEAWAKTKIEAGKLQTASEDDWERAKVYYEKASRELSDDWRKIDGENK